VVLSSKRLFILAAAISWINTMRQHPSDKLCPRSDDRLASRWHESISVRAIEKPQDRCRKLIRRRNLPLTGFAKRSRCHWDKKKEEEEEEHIPHRTQVIEQPSDLTASTTVTFDVEQPGSRLRHTDGQIFRPWYLMNSWSWKFILAIFNQRCRGYKRPRPMC